MDITSPEYVNIPPSSQGGSGAYAPLISGMGSEWKIFLIGAAVLLILLVTGAFALDLSAKVDIE